MATYNYYIDLNSDTIPNYQNTLLSPMGWVDFKNINATIPTSNNVNILYVKGSRDDSTYGLIIRGYTSIMLYPGEVGIWKMKIKRIDMVTDANSRMYIYNGIIQTEEIRVYPNYTTTGAVLSLTNSYVKCLGPCLFNTWSSRFYFNNSVFICTSFLSNSGDKFIDVRNSIIDAQVTTGVTPTNVRMSNLSIIDKSVFTGNFFQNLVAYETSLPIPTTGCIFNWTPPTWPDWNASKSDFSVALYSISSIKPFKFKDIDITATNCNNNNIKIVSKNDKLHVFSNNTYKYAHSEYSVNDLGELVRGSDDYFINGLYIKDHLNNNNNEVVNIKPYNDNISNVRLLEDNSFSITSKDKSIIFNPENDFQNDYLNKNYSPSDIYGPLNGNIFISKDIVSFNGKLNSIYGLNLSTDPMKYFSKFYNTKINSVYIKEINSVNEFIGIDFDKGFVLYDNNDDIIIINNYSTYAEIIYNNVTTTLQNTKILGACFHNNDIYYIKTKGYDSNLLNSNNYYLLSFAVLCNLKYGELKEFKIKVSLKDNFINSSNYEEYISFKSIKSVNNRLFILFNNYDCIFMTHDSNYKLHNVVSVRNINGTIVSIDYVNNNYIVGVKQINKNSYQYGTLLLTGSRLTELYPLESIPVVDIVVDKYRNYIYIATLYEFRIYDYSMNLLKKYTINPINIQYYNKIDYKNRFLLSSDVNDIRKIIGITDKQYTDTIVFNESIVENNKLIISTNDNSDKLTTENSKFITIDKRNQIPDYLDFSKIPLFENNLNTIRVKDVFSIFSKDEKTGIIVEFSYNNNLIVTIPSKNNLHDSRKTIIDAGIVPVNGEISYNSIGLKVNNNYIIFRVDNLLKIFIIDMYSGNITLAYSTTLTSTNYPEITSCVEIENRILIPFGSNFILELNINNNIITFSRYITIVDENSNSINIHQIELFNNIIYCISSKVDESGYFSILQTFDNINYTLYIIDNLKIKYNNIVIPIIKIKDDNNLSIIYNKTISLSFDKNTVFRNKYLNNEIQDISENVNFIKSNKISSISIDNESLRNSKNRNFVKTDIIDEKIYKNLYETTTGILRDFDSNIFYNIIKDIGGHIIISDIYTDRKRIDISIDMNDSNVVKRIQTDNYDIFVDDELYPKISAYIKDISDTELNLLCSLILN